MKIKVKEISYEQFLQIKNYKHFRPLKPSRLLNLLIRIASKKELKDVNFKYKKENMESIDLKNPCLILMNHSCFLDLKIAFKLLYPARFNIVMTDDGFVGKKGLMRLVGCIPTMKFITDTALVKDIFYAVNKLHDSILMYPEASYSFDGTATPIPTHFSRFVKKLNIPVIMIKTEKAFLHDPLYNNLQTRKVDVEASMKCIISKEELEKLSLDKIQEIIENEFKFDNFAYQIENNVFVKEKFRADYLNRVLYKCPSCMQEHMMIGKGITIKCDNCKKEYELCENGKIKAISGITEYDNPSSWYHFERESVKKEILNKTYSETIDVDIYGLKDLKCIYKIGKGTLHHDLNGFTLKGCNDKLEYHQSVEESYSLYSDFNWYEIDDVVCIGNYKARFYCVPTNKKDIVAMLRLATEELYKLKRT